MYDLFNDPAFIRRAQEVRRDLDEGAPMTIGDIANALGMPFELFAQCVAFEMFRRAPDLLGVVVAEVEEATKH